MHAVLDYTGERDNYHDDHDHDHDDRSAAGDL
jgi:hypothetical protein